MATRSFDGVETMEPPSSSMSTSFIPSSFPRRLTTDTLTTLRRRRTGAGRALRRPLQSSRERARDGDDEDDDDSDSEEEDEEIRLFDIICCCWGPRCCVGTCMLMLSLMGWSAAITYGILRQPTYEQIVTPVRVARQRWLSKTPHNAEEGFMLFDRNADGKIGIDDMAVVARITTGEMPTHEQLAAYIARGDLDADGSLDETEYMQMLFRERAEGKGKGKGKGKGAGSDQSISART